MLSSLWRWWRSKILKINNYHYFEMSKIYIYIYTISLDRRNNYRTKITLTKYKTKFERINGNITKLFNPF